MSDHQAIKLISYVGKLAAILLFLCAIFCDPVITDDKTLIIKAANSEVKELLQKNLQDTLYHKNNKGNKLLLTSILGICGTIAGSYLILRSSLINGKSEKNNNKSSSTAHSLVNNGDTTPKPKNGSSTNTLENIKPMEAINDLEESYGQKIYHQTERPKNYTNIENQNFSYNSGGNNHKTLEYDKEYINSLTFDHKQNFSYNSKTISPNSKINVPKPKQNFSYNSGGNNNKTLEYDEEYINGLTFHCNPSEKKLIMIE